VRVCGHSENGDHNSRCDPRDIPPDELGSCVPAGRVGVEEHVEPDGYEDHTECEAEADAGELLRDVVHALNTSPDILRLPGKESVNGCKLLFCEHHKISSPLYKIHSDMAI